jgi:hypothetical protein
VKGQQKGQEIRGKGQEICLLQDWGRQGYSLAPCPSSLAPHLSFIRALERGRDGHYAISDYRWEEFGMVFDHFIETNIESTDKAYEKFTDDSIGSVDIHDGPSTTTR